jgi:hypothetical protein
VALDQLIPIPDGEERLLLATGRTSRRAWTTPARIRCALALPTRQSPL